MRVLASSIGLVAMLLAAGCQGGATPAAGRDAAGAAGSSASVPEGAAADPMTRALPAHAQGAFERARKAVDVLRGGVTDPGRPCGVLVAARNVPALAVGDAPAEVDAALAPGERLCARDAWLIAARAQLERVAAGDTRGCGAAAAALAHIAEPHRADAETTAVAAQLAAACPAP